MGPIDYSKFDKMGDSDDEQPPAKSAPPPRSHAAPPVDPSRAEIERLKAAKREAREARGVGTEEASPAAAYADVVEATPEPLKQLDAAEALSAAMQTELAAVSAELRAASVTSEDRASLAKRVTALTSQVGKLQDAVDSISVGDLEADARDAAKNRRKALNASLESQLMPDLSALRALLKAM